MPPKRVDERVIEILSSDDDDDDCVVVAKSRRKTLAPRALGLQLPPAPAAPAPRRSSRLSDLGDGELKVVGAQAGVAQTAPHARQHCLEHPFKPGDANVNVQRCATCYCWVCDIPASTCASWGTHCNATEKESKWIQERGIARRKAAAPAASASAPRPAPAPAPAAVPAPAPAPRVAPGPAPRVAPGPAPAPARERLRRRSSRTPPAAPQRAELAAARWAPPRPAPAPAPARRYSSSTDYSSEGEEAPFAPARGRPQKAPVAAAPGARKAPSGLQKALASSSRAPQRGGGGGVVKKALAHSGSESAKAKQGHGSKKAQQGGPKLKKAPLAPLPAS
eukprot:tig00020965_g16875.t1